ncbi:MAG: hypothetical protein ABSG17_09535 [Spirochaetia bacterium]|jgi:internalin A
MNGKILRLGILFVSAVTFMALAMGCSNWVLGVIQSFGTQNGAKITTVAGNGTAGYLDSLPATSGELNQPYAVAMDSAGNLYIADGNNSLIRKVDKSGTISTVTAATGLFNPVGVAADSSGNIYISDTGNHAIEEVPAGSAITTLAKNGVSGVTLNYPYGIALDSSGSNLYIADSGNSVILELNIGSKTVTTVAGILNAPGYSGDNSAAISAHLNYPTAVTVDAFGNIYIADGSNFRIRKVDVSGKITTIAGNGVNGYSGDGGPAAAAEINQPYGVAVDSSGNLYISEINSVVRKVDTNGIITTVARNVHLGAGYGGDGNVATAAMLDEPWGLAIDNSGNLLIADFVNNRVRKVGP